MAIYYANRNDKCKVGLLQVDELLECKPVNTTMAEGSAMHASFKAARHVFWRWSPSSTW